MIKFQDGMELYTEAEFPPTLTIDELKEFAKKKIYQPRSAEILKFHTNKENGLLYTKVINTPWSNDLIDHLLMEICIQDIDKYDWRLMTDYYDYQRIADYITIWITPYTWLDEKDSDIFGYLFEGRVASMEYDKFRRTEVFEWVIKMLKERELLLGDHILTQNEDSEFEEGKSLKGMNLWSLLTTNPRKYLQFVFENGRHPVNEEENGLISYFDPEDFLIYIQNIANVQGSQKAARVVRALRKDWKNIVFFKLFNIDKISDQQVEEFRKILFEGMDYYLEQWEAETPKEESPDHAPTSAPGKPRGPKTQYLFADVRGNEDTFRSKTEAERVRKFVADHRMGNMQLDSQSTNRLNLMVACFWYRWNERGWVSQVPQGAAIYRFFTEQCELECAVLKKAFSTKICKIINEGKKDYQIYDDLDSYFRK